MALYSGEHILKERSQEWESCVEWDTRGALSMGTLFLGHGSARPRRLLPLTIELSALTTPVAYRYLFCGPQTAKVWFERRKDLGLCRGCCAAVERSQCFRLSGLSSSIANRIPRRSCSISTLAGAVTPVEPLLLHRR